MKQRASTMAARKASLAQLMADGCPTLIAAAYKLRITVEEAKTTWRAIRRDLGSQAR